MKFIKWALCILLVIILIAFALIGPIDYTPLIKQPFYQTMMRELDTTRLIQHPAHAKLRTSWSKVNITPPYPMPMAGYKPRDHFDAVHDSIFTRIAAIDNGDLTVFIISADLMLFPSVVKEKIEHKLHDLYKGKYFLYFNATHTHSSVGGWDESQFGKFILGKYHPEWVEDVSNKIAKSVVATKESLLPSSLYYWEVDAKEYVQNRLDAEHGETDGKLRGFRIVRSDSSKALLTSFSAHATNIDHKGHALTGDYPASFNNEIESNGYDFSLFLAGMVGSHRATGLNESDFEFTDMLGNVLSEKAFAAVGTETKLPDSLLIITKHIPIEYGPAQIHIAKNWKVRNWVFSLLARPLKGEFTYLQLGNIILLGTSCDFSGEIHTHEHLEQLASSKGKKLMITSFNGEYTGYITLDKYYEHLHEEEVMTLNWVGPYYGKYYTDMIKKLLLK